MFYLEKDDYDPQGLIDDYVKHLQKQMFSVETELAEVEKKKKELEDKKKKLEEYLKRFGK